MLTDQQRINLLQPVRALLKEITQDEGILNMSYDKLLDKSFESGKGDYPYAIDHRYNNRWAILNAIKSSALSARSVLVVKIVIYWQQMDYEISLAQVNEVVDGLIKDLNKYRRGEL